MDKVWTKAVLTPGDLDLKTAAYITPVKPGVYTLALQGERKAEVRLRIEGASPYLFVIQEPPYVYENEYVKVLRP